MISRVIRTGTFLGVFAAPAFVLPLGAQDSARRPPRASATVAIPVASFAGQTVAVLPVTMVVAEPAVKNDTGYAAYQVREVALAWADSTIGSALTERAPEVSWVLPEALRKIARRSPGMVKDPDGYGQAVLRSPRMKEVPEPLRAELRSLVAIAGGRFTLVPAAVHLSREAGGGLRADLSLVLVDARAGKILWRSLASGLGTTPAAAVDAALTTALPLDLPTP